MMENFFPLSLSTPARPPPPTSLSRSLSLSFLATTRKYECIGAFLSILFSLMPDTSALKMCGMKKKKRRQNEGQTVCRENRRQRPKGAQTFFGLFIRWPNIRMRDSV